MNIFKEFAFYFIIGTVGAVAIILVAQYIGGIK